MKGCAVTLALGRGDFGAEARPTAGVVLGLPRECTPHGAGVGAAGCPHLCRRAADQGRFSIPTALCLCLDTAVVIQGKAMRSASLTCCMVDGVRAPSGVASSSR